MSLLYEAEAKGVSPHELLRSLEVRPDPLTEELVAGVGENVSELDGLLSSRAQGWVLERMPALDRALLRLGAYELAHRPEVPEAVVLAEAVELASAFSTEASARYVNGVLAALASSLRGPRSDDEAPPLLEQVVEGAGPPS